MKTNHITTTADKQINAAAVDDIVKSLAIPPQPEVVMQMQTEMGKADPDVRKAADIVSQDVGLTVAVLKAVNSPLYGLQRQVTSVDQAVGIIGLKQLSMLVTAIAMRQSIKGDSQTLARFYDLSSKRSFAMTRLARELRAADTGHAQMFGLFCDVAIPLLIARFPTYTNTLAQAYSDATGSFTATEHATHHTDHALVGAIMAKTWGLPRNVCLAIRLHHDYAIFLDAKVPRDIANLVALNLIAEAAMARHAGTRALEWEKGEDYVAGALVLSPHEVDELIQHVQEDFAAGIG